MTVEAYWYSSYVNGEAPRIRMIPWNVRVDPDTPRRLALAFGAGDGYAYLYDDADGYGRAGYRPVGPIEPGLHDHMIWYWIGSGMPGEWFYIPYTVVGLMYEVRRLVMEYMPGEGDAVLETFLAALADRALVERIVAGRG